MWDSMGWTGRRDSGPRRMRRRSVRRASSWWAAWSSWSRREICSSLRRSATGMARRKPVKPRGVKSVGAEPEFWGALGAGGFGVADGFHGAADQVEEGRGVAGGGGEVDGALDGGGVGAEEGDGELARAQASAGQLGGELGQQIFEGLP